MTDQPTIVYIVTDTDTLGQVIISEATIFSIILIIRVICPIAGKIHLIKNVLLWSLTQHVISKVTSNYFLCTYGNNCCREEV